MPELPEVETVCRGLRPTLVGHRLQRVVQRRSDLRFALPIGFARQLEGRAVAAVGRRGKYILIGLDDGMTLICHLGMSGRMVLGPDPDAPHGPHDHVDLVTDAGVLVRFNDARRFGMMDLWPTLRLGEHRLLADLGMEPLSYAFNGPALAAQLGGRRTSIKAALLDQRVVAGLGNIYACESLYYAGLSPRRQAYTVQGRRAERLVWAIRHVLTQAVEAGGSSLRDYVQASGELGYFQHHWAVYGRAGEACPDCTCDVPRTGGVRCLVQNGRTTFFCPRRQR
jgi:formamidopyrimidine-DNA glycosylase